MSDEKKSPAPAAPATVAATATCNRCKRHMFASELTTEKDKTVCNARQSAACNRIAGERKPRAKVGG